MATLNGIEGILSMSQAPATIYRLTRQGLSDLHREPFLLAKDECHQICHYQEPPPRAGWPRQPFDGGSQYFATMPTHQIKNVVGC
jgi:hypothetical protein